MKNEWISVEDRLPEKEEFVLVSIGDKEVGFATLDEMGSWYTRNNRILEGITHWMPLPEPPKPKELTFKDKFLEAFPKADIEDGDDGNSLICRNAVFFGRALCSQFPICSECWNQPYFESEEEGEAE